MIPYSKRKMCRKAKVKYRRVYCHLLKPSGCFTVIPAQAGIQAIQLIAFWIPACAGMTRVLS